MGILNSFHIGVSGLGAAGDGMSVIGDNIANAGTNGFKASRAEFQDVLSRSLKGIDGGDQIGAGTKMAHVKPKFTQGTITRTENVTDIAISGDGFFQVNAPFGKGYTRDGSFQFDKDGLLTTGDGYTVDGFEADEKGKISNKIGNIKLGNTTIPAKATTGVNVSMNLDTREPVKEFNIEDADNTSSFSTGVTVYDNVGTERLLTVYFNKTGDNTWQYHVTALGADAAAGNEENADKPILMGNGTLVFNDKGLLQEEQVGSESFNFNKGAAPDQQIKFNFGESITEGGTGLDASTQYGSRSSVSLHTQDGYSAATIASMSFNDKGVLTAVYSNGVARDVGQVALAKFASNEGLFKVGKNMAKATRKSGQAVIGQPGFDGRGNVLAKSIEMSNVDIAQEFVNLMTAQRNFTANAKTITTADQMLQEVLNIKR